MYIVYIYIYILYHYITYGVYAHDRTSCTASVIDVGAAANDKQNKIHMKFASINNINNNLSKDVA